MEDETRLGRCARCGVALPIGATEELCAACAAAVTDSPTMLSATARGADETFAALPPGSVSGTNDRTVLSGVSRDPFRPRTAPNLGPGQVFGHYRIGRLLGRGGMGEVYEAEHLEHGRRVALKVLTGRFAGAEDRARFLREGELAASINHPNTVYVYGSEEIDLAPVITMELLSGGTLKDVVQARGALPTREAVDLILHVIAGLEAANAAGILHRDIKPANCFVDDAGAVKVGDFGLSIAAVAREQAATGMFQGTPQFAAPEQLRGEALDLRADIYAVGATLFYLLTGQPPFDDNDLTTLITRVQAEPARSAREMRAGVPDALADLVSRCLAKDRAQRPASYAALEDELRPLSSTAAVPAPLGRRALSGLIDHALFSLIVVPLMMYFAMSGSTRLGLRVAVIHALAIVSYFATLESRWGASLGKRLFGLRVVRLDGQRPEFFRALLRAVIYQATALVSIVPTAMIGSQRISEWSAQHPAVGLTMGLGFYVALAVLFSTARRHNGFATLYDLATGTRVVRKPARTMRAGADLGTAKRQAASTDLRRLGPYEITGSLGSTGAGELLIGRDARLSRNVWIHRLPPGAPAVPAALQNVGRQGRLRWLNGQRTDAVAWDAYEAFDGAPLTALEPPQPWRLVRRWLHDLAIEIDAATKDESLGTLNADRVWITPDGAAKLLDFPAPGASADAVPVAAPVTATAAQSWLASVAQRSLDGLAGRRAAAPTPLPLSARIVLDQLRAGSLASPADVVQATAGLTEKVDAVTWKRRAGAIAASAVMPVLLAIMGLFAAYGMQRLAEFSPDIDALVLAFRNLSGETEAGRKMREPERQALEAYVAERFRATIAAPSTWTHPLNAARLAQYRPLAERLIAEHPSVSPAQFAADQEMLGPFLEEQAKALRAQQDKAKVAMRVAPIATGLIGLGMAAGVGIILAFALRGGLMLKVFGLAVVDARGLRISRWRALLRSVVAWLPAAALVGIGFTTDVLMSADSAAKHPVWFALAVLAGVVFLGGAAVAVWRPWRGLQDRIAGTWIVPA